MGLFKTINNGMDILVDKAVFGQRKMKSIDGPTFLKDFSKDNKQLKDLEELYSKLKSRDKKNYIEKDIIALKQGMNGENNVYYELKSSGIPMYCLHNIRLEYKGLSAQIDFAEGMYSPVEQNNKHIKLIKNILAKEFKIKRMPVKSMVVMANPKAIINKSKCPKELKDVVIRHEQITKHIEKAINEIEYSLSEDNVKEVECKEKQPKNSNACARSDIEKNPEDAELYERLHTYRNNKAKEEGYDFRHYHYVFSKSVIEQLIEIKPTSVSELFKIRGLGQVKVGKYGEDIVR